jgi:hypothetical protein
MGLSLRAWDEPGDGERSERDGQAGVGGLVLVVVFGPGGPRRPIEVWAAVYLRLPGPLCIL